MSWDDLRKGRYSHEQGEYFITFNTQNRAPYFHDFDLACLFSQQIMVNETKHNCLWLAWVLMPDHFHGLLRLNLNASTLSNVVKGLKGRSSLIINKKCGQPRRLWQSSFYDRALRIDEDKKQVARYILANPLRKGLVNNIANYPFWNSIYL